MNVVDFIEKCEHEGMRLGLVAKKCYEFDGYVEDGDAVFFLRTTLVMPDLRRVPSLLEAITLGSKQMMRWIEIVNQIASEYENVFFSLDASLTMDRDAYEVTVAHSGGLTTLVIHHKPTAKGMREYLDEQAFDFVMGAAKQFFDERIGEMRKGGAHHERE